MRRHLALIGLIMAVIIGIYILGSRRALPHRPTEDLKSLNRQEPEATFSNPDSGELATTPMAATAPPWRDISAPLAAQSETARPLVAPEPKTKKVRVELSPPIEGAAVILMRSRDFLETYTPSELRSRKDGSIEFDVLAERELVLIYAYVPGVGHSSAHHRSSTVTETVRMSLHPAAVLKIACMNREGEPLKNVEVTVRGELEIWSSHDGVGNYLGSKYVQLPARKATTTDNGRCEFEFLNRGWIRDKATTRVPGWKFTISASGPGGGHEEKIDGIPGKEVVLVLD